MKTTTTATTTSTSTTITTWAECDDCGRQVRTDRAQRYDYTCPAPRTAYVCRRCHAGNTPITRAP